MDSYPLQWPLGWPRTPQHQRKHARYRVEFKQALDECMHELKLMGARDIVISSNLMLRKDGLPYANQREPADSAIAVYWTQDKQQRVIACDTWLTRGDNMRAARLNIAALRMMQRTGATKIMDRAFQAFAALPRAPGMPRHGVHPFRRDRAAPRSPRQARARIGQADHILA